MLDFLYLLLTIVVFAAMLAYARACERLGSRTGDGSADGR
jgi:hypothetical protein